MFTPTEKEEDPILANYQVEGENEETLAEDIPGTDVHTMPAKFLQPGRVPKKKGRISWVILSIVIFIVLGAVIAAVVIFLSGQKQAEIVVRPVVTNPAENTNMAQPANGNVNDNVNSNSNNNVNQDTNTPARRDQQRLTDVFDVRSALNMYFDQQGVYPSALSTLLRDYLNIVPENPALDGEAYAYSTNDDKSDFIFTFALESGGTLGNLVLEPGKYQLSSSGVIPAETEGVSVPPDANLPDLPKTPLADVPPAIGQDADGDLLTDVEENLYQTDSALRDTDGDGYEDLNEILSLYDPTKGGGARLFDSGLINVYKNSEYHYSLFYPATWTARPFAGDNKEIIFNSAIGEFVEIMIQPNPLGLSAYNWYLEQNEAAVAKNLNTLLVDNLPAVQSPNGLTTYLGVGSNIYIITYNIGAAAQMNFYSTYQLFLKTFIFVDSAEPPAAEAASTSTEPTVPEEGV